MERGLLSDEKLSELYGDVVWMYLFQDFSHSEADRAAERIAIRFGITSWPQHFLVDPRSLEVIADTGRSLESFRSAFAGAKVEARQGVTTEQLIEADALAAKLEGKVSVAEAKRYLDHADLVVRYRAIQRLEATAPEAIVKAAGALLEVPHDQTRFLVCQVLAASGDLSVREQLEGLVRRPDGSRNPNVLRMHTVRALARCGDGHSIAAIGPFAASGEYFNGLTGTAIDALVAIAARVRGERGGVSDVLKTAFPQPKPDTDEREQRACQALARRVHEALETVTGKERAFPAVYDEKAREQLTALWR